MQPSAPSRTLHYFTQFLQLSSNTDINIPMLPTRKLNQTD